MTDAAQAGPARSAGRAQPPRVTPDGLIIVDKPAGWTSHDVVSRMRRLASTRRVGHAGTLDPMATGVLVIGVNRATKLLTFLVGCDKEYTATIRLGASTLTDDAEGEITALAGANGVDNERIEDAVARLRGDIMQVPSAVSAIKIDGKRSYHRVRSGEDVELPARAVTVSSLVINDVRRGQLDGVRVLDVDVTAAVSSGTYVRALARDLGASVGVGGHLTALRRTRVGAFTLDQAHSLDDLASLADSGPDAGLPVIPMAQAAADAFPVHHITADEERALGYGQRIASGSVREDVVAAIAPDGRLTAVLDETRERAKSRVTFPA